MHTLFGEDVIAAIADRVKSRAGTPAGSALGKTAAACKEAFALGCQGPDIFYHSRRRRPVGLEYGTLLHRRGIGRFAAGLLNMALPQPPENGIDERGAYALGFMTHAILDRSAHPFIVYKSFRAAPPAPNSLSYAQSHAFFERVIDTLMFKTLRGAEIAEWDQEGILSAVCAEPPPGLQEMIAAALISAFPERAEKDEKLKRRIENTFLDCASFYRMTAQANVARQILSIPPELHKDHLVYICPEILTENPDFLNRGKRPWFYPAGAAKEDTRSFPEIYAQAAAQAVDSLSPIIAGYFETGVFPVDQAAEAVGNGGLSIVDEAGHPCPPCRSDPFPLDETLEQQVIIRRAKIN